MINTEKQYRTRDGREVRIYATDGGGSRPVHGAYLTKNGFWISATWMADGKWDSENDAYNLIEVKPRHKRTVWINLYETDGGTAFASKKYADLCAASRIACIKVDLDFEEGEGL
jgi:hypothetical protein